MPKFAANLSFLFTEIHFPERFARAAAAGFRGVEYLFPYDWPAAEIAGWLRAADLEQVLFNLPAGDWAAGERGLACLPQRQGDFVDSVDRALDYAVVLDCRRVHCMAGLRPTGVDEAVIEATYVANLRHCADRFATIGATVMIEAINSRIDMPGYWLDTPARAFELVARIDRPNVAVQFDVYHAQVVAGDHGSRPPRDSNLKQDVLGTRSESSQRAGHPVGASHLAQSIEANLDRIGHVQVADSPGRHEPGSGEIDYPTLFGLLDRLGYSGWVGCEYRPMAGTEAGLGWIKALR